MIILNASTNKEGISSNGIGYCNDSTEKLSMTQEAFLMYLANNIDEHKNKAALSPTLLE